jgi:hypothetical protein
VKSLREDDEGDAEMSSPDHSLGQLASWQWLSFELRVKAVRPLGSPLYFPLILFEDVQWMPYSSENTPSSSNLRAFARQTSLHLDHPSLTCLLSYFVLPPPTVKLVE